MQAGNMQIVYTWVRQAKILRVFLFLWAKYKPNIDISAGTSLYKIKDNPKLLNSNVKYEFYKSGIADDSYDDVLSDHNNSFVETVRFNNVYNRMIAFDGTTYHKANSYYSEGEPRLCQVFFVEAFQSSSLTPIQRSKSYKQGQE